MMCRQKISAMRFSAVIVQKALVNDKRVKGAYSHAVVAGYNHGVVEPSEIDAIPCRKVCRFFRMLFDIEERCRLSQDRLAARVPAAKSRWAGLKSPWERTRKSRRSAGPRSAASCLRGLAKTEMHAASRMSLMFGQSAMRHGTIAERANDVSLRASLS